jgi:hypothetical protein
MNRYDRYIFIPSTWIGRFLSSGGDNQQSR